jgi:hypothetical protein
VLVLHGKEPVDAKLSFLHQKIIQDFHHQNHEEARNK